MKTQLPERHDRIRGAFLGLATGDVHGAPFEGDWAARTLWKVIGRTRSGEMRWTDDTQMSIDLAESLLECDGLDIEDLAHRFGASYAWSRGYGPGAAKTLKAIRNGAPIESAARRGFPDGSWGNGGAMRAPVLALWPWESRGALRQASHDSAGITHAHSEGQDGAWLLAHATALALDNVDPSDLWPALKDGVRSEFLLDQLRAAEGLSREGAGSIQVALRNFGTGMSARTSCVSAIYAALHSRHGAFEDMLADLRAQGGDVDTLSAMAGAIWGAYRGASSIPETLLRSIEDRQRLEGIADRLAIRSAGPRA